MKLPRPRERWLANRGARLRRIEARILRESNRSVATGARDELEQLAARVRELRRHEAKVERKSPGQDWI